MIREQNEKVEMMNKQFQDLNSKYENVRKAKDKIEQEQTEDKRNFHEVSTQLQVGALLLPTFSCTHDYRYQQMCFR